MPDRAGGPDRRRHAGPRVVGGRSRDVRRQPFDARAIHPGPIGFRPAKMSGAAAVVGGGAPGIGPRRREADVFI
ncbi:MAG: hypothetical protein EXS37_01905 [Opitutus sp.]|nr:hypothetical protein [Opitutus sp.]